MSRHPFDPFSAVCESIQSRCSGGRQFRRIHKNFHVYENNILAGKEENFHQRSTYASVLFKFFPRLSINFEIIQCHKKPKVASDAQTHIKKLQKPEKSFIVAKKRGKAGAKKKLLLFFSVSINFRYKSICRMGLIGSCVIVDCTRIL